MNITSESMQSLIMNNVGELHSDPHLKKLFAELNALKRELNGGTKTSNKRMSSNEFKNDCETPVTEKKKKRRQTDGGEAFRAAYLLIPDELRRKSDRLSGKLPRYNYMDDIDEIENSKLFSNGALRLNRIAKRPRTSIVHRRATQRIILSPEEITKEMLENIAFTLNDRIYDPHNGTCCHQCRQKTTDTKTICRNIECVGLRGQFCGPCAKNRYGCDIVDALLDPHWICFVCQGVCNCSFCRSKKGKMPTGILAPIAKREGHKSVKDFLDSLVLLGIEEADYTDFLNDRESLFGFVDHDTAMTVGGSVKLILGSLGGFKVHLYQAFIEDFGTYFGGFSDESLMEAKKRVEVSRLILDSLLVVAS